MRVLKVMIWTSFSLKTVLYYKSFSLSLVYVWLLSKYTVGRRRRFIKILALQPVDGLGVEP